MTENNIEILKTLIKCLDETTCLGPSTALYQEAIQWAINELSKKESISND